MRIILFLCLFTLFAPIVVGENLPPPIKSFAGNQSVSMVKISPNGKYLAFLKHENNQTLVAIKDNPGQIVKTVNLFSWKPVGIFWAGNNHLLISVSKTDKDARLKAALKENEYIRVFSYNLETEKIIALLKASTKKLARVSINLGWILAIDHEMPAVFISALNRRYQPDMFRVNLENGRGVVVKHGDRSTRNWVVNSQNEVVARAIYRQEFKDFEIQIPRGKSWKTIYKTKAEIVPFFIKGLNLAQNAIVISFAHSDHAFLALYEMDLQTGKISGPLFSHPKYDVNQAIQDPYSNLVIGASWIQDMREFYWFDPQLAEIYTQLKNSIPGLAFRLASWTKDRSQFVVAYAKAGQPEQFGLYHPETHDFEHLVSSRPALDNVTLGKVKALTYAARDGLEIQAYLTLPPNSDLKNLPLVVLPHGGPESRDLAEFNWMAQLFASRGYAVFQPNFRGSSGYGRGFTKAGWGQWGKAMQHDITDGVKQLIAQGSIDPKRICIVGASYGGYAALAGGAFTPELYKCIVSIAGVADLNAMYKWTWKEYGRDHWVVRYWDRSMSGDEKRSKAMKAASPIRFVKQFQAPVLLIHGKDDTVVRISQSKAMQRALKRAKIDVRLVQQEKGDHWMSFEETRMQTAGQVLTFLDQHIGK